MSRRATPPVPRLAWTTRETARRLAVSEPTVRRRVKEGRLRAIRVGGTVRIPWDIEAHAEQLPMECTPRQVANSLDVSELTVRRWIRAGNLPATWRSHRWRIRRTDLQAILDGTTWLSTDDHDTCSGTDPRQPGEHQPLFDVGG